MRVFLISANEEQMPDPVPPIGLAYIAAALLRAGHDCYLFDCNFERALRDLEPALLDFRPQVIGLSLRNVDNTAYPYGTSYLPHYQRIGGICRDTMPEVPLVLGGSAFSLFPQAFMDALSADFGIAGEGELFFPRLLSDMEKGTAHSSTRRIFYPGAQRYEFGDLVPARHLLDVNKYFRTGGSINLQTKRGCVYQCSYCTYPLLEGAQIRKRKPAGVVDEMEECLQRYGVDYFFFVDSVFNQPPSHAKAVAEEMVRRKLPVKWTAYLSPANADEALFAAMAEAGCASLDFGTDAAHGGSLSSLGKQFGLEEIRRCSQWCHRYGIKFNHSLLFGTPGETRDSIEATIDNILDCEPTAVTAFCGIRLYPNTPLALKLEREGWIARSEIGLNPVFFVEEAVRDFLLERLGAVADEHANWIVPGLGRQMKKRLFQRMRSRGVKGPLWEML